VPRPKKLPSSRQTQAERRKQTQDKVLESAVILFGERGYADTSLADIAKLADITVTPIYHYYGNKLELFTAVTEFYEGQLAGKINELAENEDFSAEQAWDIFLDVMQQPGFNRVVLIDATRVLGRERWPDTSVFKAVKALLNSSEHPIGAYFHQLFNSTEAEIVIRMVIAALAEAAIAMAEDSSFDARSLVHRILGMMGVDWRQENTLHTGKRLYPINGG